MKLSDLLVDPDKLATYSPPRHTDTLNHRLWPQQDDPDAPIEVIHGHLGAGGGADPHFHAKSDQMIYLLSGALKITGIEDSVTMAPGQFIFVPKYLEHRVDILNPEGVDIIVMYMPRLSLDDILPAKSVT